MTALHPTLARARDEEYDDAIDGEYVDLLAAVKQIVGGRRVQHQPERRKRAEGDHERAA